MTPDGIILQLIKMPCKIKAAVTANDDGSYTIFLNKNHSYETLRSAAAHELRHILQEDLSSEQSADEIESNNNS